MKTWWYSLAERERRLIMMGSIVIGICLIWFYAIKPIFKYKTQLKADVTSLQSDQTYFQQLKPQVTALRSQNKPQKANKNVRLQRVIEPLLRRHQLHGANTLENLSSNSNGSVSLSLKSAPFDQVATFLGAMELHHQAYATRLNIQPLKTTGRVRAQITLQR